MKVISVEDVSKKFVLSHSRPTNLADAARNVFSRAPREDFWALKNINFEVEQGEAIGIIGPNGAGKSTMLKLLTKIMKPNSGRLRTRGRISALIEVGAGFHPEMTGRENIYLNGAILGMTRREIDGKFDGIVAFAELERFIDTPVKRYSSGMYARLGFAVAAHVDPEILIVDEVLSVGDAGFQNRCSERIREIKRLGASVVFVSHNFSAVCSVCSRVIGLWCGVTFADCGPSEAIAKYRELLAYDVKPSVKTGDGMEGEWQSDMTIVKVESVSSAGNWRAYTDDSWTLRIHYSALKTVSRPEIALRIITSEGIVIAQPCTIDYGQARDVCGSGVVEFRVDRLPLVPGRYGVEVFVWDTNGLTAYDHGRHAYDLVVLDDISQATEIDLPKPGIRFGLVKLPGEWIFEAPDIQGGSCATP